jgi:hypothetical protein
VRIASISTRSSVSTVSGSKSSPFTVIFSPPTAWIMAGLIDVMRFEGNVEERG